MINISCHSGLFVHISLALDKRTIDIINEADEKWLNAWIDNKKSYERIIKSNNSQYKIVFILISFLSSVFFINYAL